MVRYQLAWSLQTLVTPALAKAFGIASYMAFYFAVGLCFLFITQKAQATGPPENDWRTALVNQGVARLEKLIAQNAVNDQLGQSYKNQYVVELASPQPVSGAPIQQGVHTEERGVANLQMLPPDKLKALDASLQTFHQKHQAAKTGFYIIVINDWQTYLQSQILPTETSLTIELLNQKVAQSQTQAWNTVKAQMAGIPAEILASLKNKGYTNQQYVYLYGRLLFYSAAAEVSKPRIFYHCSFAPDNQYRSEQIRSQLPPLRNLLDGYTTHSDRLQAVIDKFVQAYESPVATAALDATLTRTHQLPQGEMAGLLAMLTGSYQPITQLPSAHQQHVYDYLGLIKDQQKKQQLENLLKQYDIRDGEQSGNVYVNMLYTDYRMPADKITALKQYVTQLGANDLVFWLHIEQSGLVRSNLFFGPGLQSRLTRDFMDHLTAWVAAQARYHHRMSSIPVKLVAYVAGSLSKFIKGRAIDPIYWNAALPAYDDRLMLLYYAMQTVNTSGSGAVAQLFTGDEDDVLSRMKGAIGRDCALKQKEFALLCGLWGGGTYEVAALADLVKMLCDVYTSPPTIDQVNQVINAILLHGALGQLIDQWKSRYSAEQYNDYQIAYHAGADIVAVATLFVAVGELTAASKFAGVARAFNTLNMLTWFKYIKVVRLAGQMKRLLVFGEYYIEVVKAGVKYEFKLLDATSRALSKSFSELGLVPILVSHNGINYSLYGFERLKNSLSQRINYIQELARDANNTRLMAIQTADKQLHFALQTVDVLSLLQSRFPGISNQLANGLSQLADIEKLLAKTELVNAIESLGQKRNSFLESLLSRNASVKPPANLLSNHLDEIDEQIIAVWQVLDQNSNIHKKVDFEFLKENKGKSTDQILEAVRNPKDRPVSELVEATWSNVQKNLAVLETTEEKMAEALRRAFEQGDRSIFSEAVMAKLRVMLDKNHIGGKTMASQVRETMIKEFNETMGKSLSFDQLMNITRKDQLDLVSQQGSRGSMFESWIEHNLGTHLGLNGKKSLVYNGKQITIDNHRIVVLADKRIVIGVELKHIDDRLAGEPLEQLKRYGELLRNNSIEIKGIEYIFSSESIAKLNENLIRLTLPNNTFRIYYIKNGILTQL